MASGDGAAAGEALDTAADVPIVTRRREAHMAKLTEAEKARTKIARDVIKQLDAKKIRAVRNNTYVSLPKKKGDPCTVCAIGAMMVAKYGPVGADNETSWSLVRDGVLSEVQKSLVENYFEGIIEYGAADCVNPGYPVPSKPWSIRRIMTNIINNRGTFVP